MCPLRFILIFLSATLAGFFLIRNLKSPSQDFHAQDHTSDSNSSSSPNSIKISSGFWTVVDMASGRYLWRHLFSSSSEKASD
ncbi:hypothetical protein IC575_027698 [Cucumis melo]